MNDQLPPNTPSVSQSITDETIIGCMRKSKSMQDWEMREKNFRFKLGEEFPKVWTRVILLSGVAEEMFRMFEGSVDVNSADLWKSIKVSEGSGKIAPL